MGSLSNNIFKVVSFVNNKKCKSNFAPSSCTFPQNRTNKLVEIPKLIIYNIRINHKGAS